MPVGVQLTKATVDGQISSLAQQWRDLAAATARLSMNVNGQGNGLAVLEAAGYTSDEAVQAQSAISYLNTSASVYLGTATQASQFNFNQELSQYWGGQ